MSETASRRYVDLRIATYNIHRCRGMDRRTMPSRIAEVIREMNADVVALQEVIGAGPSGAGQAEEIGAALGMGWVMHSVRQLRNHHFGNVVLSRFPVVASRPLRADLAHAARSAPASASTSTSATAAVLHIYNVHLGTAVLERRYQAGRLAAFVHDHRIKGPKVILGDFNEWMKGLATKTLSALFNSIDIAST